MTNEATPPATAVSGRAPRRAESTPQNGPQDHSVRLPQDGVDPAEALLHALIAECHTIIREDVIPTSRCATEAYERARFYQSVVDLIGVANSCVDAIARLRGGGATSELRQRITVERVQPLIANPHAAKGEG